MRRWLQGILLIISVILISIAIYSLMGMFGDYRKEHDMHEHLKRIHEQEREPAEPESDGGEGDSSEDTAETEEMIVIDEGLLALHEENPDCIYWIRIPDTQIDYPVMYHPQEKDYYLKKDFYGEYAYAGSIYLSDYCDPEESDNLILYGHHMNNGSMFADLDRYKDPEFGRAHDLIELQTLHGAEYYRVIAAFAVPVYTGNDFLFYGFTKAENRQEYDNFIKECRERSLYEIEKTAVYKQRLLTLSTCEYSHKNGRMVVVAVQES